MGRQPSLITSTHKLQTKLNRTATNPPKPATRFRRRITKHQSQPTRPPWQITNTHKRQTKCRRIATRQHKPATRSQSSVTKNRKCRTRSHRSRTKMANQNAPRVTPTAVLTRSCLTVDDNSTFLLLTQYTSTVHDILYAWILVMKFK